MWEKTWMPRTSVRGGVVRAQLRVRNLNPLNIEQLVDAQYGVKNPKF